MSEIAKSIKEKSIFVTSSLDIVRDYITPQDLLTLLFCVIDNSTENTSFDVYSKSPVSKFEILKVLKDSFQLSFQVTENLNLVNSQKNSYFSENHNAHLIGYDPVFTSLEGILFELKRMLK
jgi:nucleoside-diphosphate-sugar epimerase